MEKERLLNDDIRAIQTLEILKEWIDAVVETGTVVYTELRKIKQNDGGDDFILPFFLLDDLDELENSDPDFYFLHSWLNQEFWVFVGAVARSRAVLDDEAFRCF